VTLNNLKPGHHSVWAVATDNQGATSAAQPVTVHIEGVAPVLSIHYEGREIVIDWIPSDAILEEASSITGPWTPLPNIPPPRRVTATPGKSMFYRAHMP